MHDLSSELRQFCKNHRLSLNTDLGQHFLKDQEVLDAIIDASEIEEHDHIVEIGPGIGVLTRELLQCNTHVTAIELDKRMIPLLQIFTSPSLPTPHPKLAIIHQNALQVDMPKEPYRMVANIPYHITSPLLRHVFLESSLPPKSMTLLIQKEVADRICDTQNSDLLSITVQIFGTARKVIDVPPESFLPPPKVDSSVIHIDCFLHPKTSIEVLEQLLKLAKIAFAQKRKMLRNSFGTFPGGLELLQHAEIDETRRPQTLSIDEWIALAETALQSR